MTITPFLGLRLRGKRDAVLARQRARRVASLLSFDVHEQACIAAGAFMVACQALTMFHKPRLCFQVENRQLQIFAEDANPVEPSAQRLARFLPEADLQTPFRVVKDLPAQPSPAEEIELGWLVRKVEEVAGEGVFAEIVKQNQEMLALLHELRLCRGHSAQIVEKSAGPDAA